MKTAQPVRTDDRMLLARALCSWSGSDRQAIEILTMHNGHRVELRGESCVNWRKPIKRVKNELKTKVTNKQREKRDRNRRNHRPESSEYAVNTLCKKATLEDGVNEGKLLLPA